tara:strand:- start:689 stop:1099 length:411 start_codon:yes stop_codon:yes gene_type:complete
MVIGKISSLASTIIVFALAFIFIKQAYGSSIGTAGIDVGQGLTSTAGGITSVINAFLSPISGLIGSFSSLFGSFGNSNGARNEPSTEGRDERRTPDNRVRTGDTSTISWSSGTSATVPSLSPAAKSYYAARGVNVS